VQAKRVSAAEATQLEEALLHEMHTEFGKRHEEAALR
jgi:hypothetical protein